MDIQLDQSYKTWVKQLKEKVYSARMRAVLAVNQEQIKLYWEIGKAIIDQQKKSHWGAKLLDQISRDLRSTFPDMKGFSITNLKYMRMFAQLYPSEIGQQPVDQLPYTAQPVSQLPWGHIVVLIQKVKDVVAREWYIQQAIENGWARVALERHIRSELYERQGKQAQKLSNFKSRLPAPQSDLAPGKFKPEYAGKLNFYIAVVDDVLKKEHHAPTIGLLLCETKNRMVAEYALNKSDSPMGISEYQLSKTIPKALQGTLPSVELLEEKLSAEKDKVATACDE